MEHALSFQSTLPARGATQDVYNDMQRKEGISIHAPREGSDTYADAMKRKIMLISIHAPREGSDSACWLRKPCSQRFQSTLPARGATRMN